MMRAADEARLAKFITKANNVRATMLTDGVSLVVVSAILSVDGRITTLRWSSGETDPSGNVMPDDWIVTVE